MFQHITGSKTQESNQNVLYIAMAGTHQIWVLYLEDGPWLKGGYVKYCKQFVKYCNNLSII
jgi:hypothetical protein